MALAARVYSLFFAKNDEDIPRRFVQNGVEYEASNARYHVSHGNLFGPEIDGELSFSEALTQDEARAFAEKIDDLNVLEANLFSFDKTHRRVLAHKEWRKLYGADLRSFAHVAPGTTSTIVNYSMDSAPCAICGIILPTTILQIDHRHPQSGGGLLAVLKVFRALGLTINGPKGVQGRTVKSTGQFGGFTARPPQGYFKSVIVKFPKPIQPVTSEAFRHFLDEKGNALLSLFRADPGASDELDTACMNSALNLQPMCAPCNNAKSNTLKYKQ